MDTGIGLDADVFPWNRQNSVVLVHRISRWTRMFPMLMLAASLIANANAETIPQSGNVAQVLHANPFEKPVIARVQTLRPVVPVPVEVIDWQPELRATLVGGARSAANVDGAILYVGNRVKDYVLVEIHDRSVVFEKEGVRRILKMDE